jgi:hypothetical protein
VSALARDVATSEESARSPASKRTTGFMKARFRRIRATAAQTLKGQHFSRFGPRWRARGRCRVGQAAAHSWRSVHTREAAQSFSTSTLALEPSTEVADASRDFRARSSPPNAKVRKPSW